MDTVVLVIKSEQYRVTRPDMFNPRFQPIDPHSYEDRVSFLKNYKGLRKYVQNPSPEKRKSGVIYPNLTIYERIRGRSYSADLHIAISLPKLLFGHSFNHVYSDHIEKVVDLLIGRLKNMGVETSVETLRCAIVNTIHFAINIRFPSIELASMFLQRTSLTSIGGWYEKNIKTYSNNGNAVRFHSNIFQIVFYLKYSDLLVPKGRSMDKRRTLQEEEIAKELQKKGTIPPIIRMEVRLNGIRSVSNHLESVLNLKKSYWTLEETFSSEISKKVLKHYWSKITSDMINYSLLCDYSDKDICHLIRDQHKETDISVLFDAFGMFYVLRSLGVKDMREFVYLRQSKATWYRRRRKIIAFINRYAKPNSKLIDIVNEALERDYSQLEISGLTDTFE